MLPKSSKNYCNIGNNRFVIFMFRDMGTLYPYSRASTVTLVNNFETAFHCLLYRRLFCFDFKNVILIFIAISLIQGMFPKNSHWTVKNPGLPTITKTTFFSLSLSANYKWHITKIIARSYLFRTKTSPF